MKKLAKIIECRPRCGAKINASTPIAHGSITPLRLGRIALAFWTEPAFVLTPHLAAVNAPIEV